jgi:hypothetical protein
VTSGGGRGRDTRGRSEVGRWRAPVRGSGGAVRGEDSAAKPKDKDGEPSSPCGVPEGEGKENGPRPGGRWARPLKSPDDFGTHPLLTRLCISSETFGTRRIEEERHASAAHWIPDPGVLQGSRLGASLGHDAQRCPPTPRDSSFLR